MSHRLPSVSLVVVLSVLGAAGVASAEPLRAEEVPAPLKPWVSWVLRGHEAERCPTLPEAKGKEGERLCAWAGKLDLVLDGNGGRFHQDWDVIAESAVPLPGDDDHWPLEVKADGKPALVAGDGDPEVRLSPGHHVLTGAFAWRRLPQSLPLPPAVGLVALTLGGRRVERPERGEDGALFLQAGAAKRDQAEADRMDVSVHRKVIDQVPLLLATRITLAVAGKMREETLGRALPSGFQAHALESGLPARLEPDGRLRVQVRPGTFTITLTGRLEALPKTITRPVPGGTWKEGEEVWVFEAQPALRVVTVEGVPAVDPRQTTLPREWQGLPAYVMAPGATMTLVEHRRGDADPPPDQLTLDRHLWLDFDGGGYTARDQVSGKLARSWRLEMGAEAELGRVSVGGVDQFITRLGEGRPAGVELRQTQLSLTADSRIEGRGGSLAAVGWAHDFDSVSATLTLPPGWRLLHASGADSAGPTWIKGWTLLDLFLVMIVSLAVGKLFGPRFGVLALLALGLTVTEGEAPGWVWLVVAVGEALCRALPAGWLLRLARVYRLGAWLALVVIAFPYGVGVVRGGLYPALASSSEGGSVGHIMEEQAPPHHMVAAKANAPAAPAAEEESEKREEAKAPADRLARARLSAGAAGLSGLLGSVDRSTTRQQWVAQNLAAYDPDVQVQTGPGVPTWSWSDVHLGWNGPVEQDARLSLWLVPPAVNLALAFLRVALVLALALLFLSPALPWARRRFGAAAAALVIVLLGAGAARAAELPDEDLRNELRGALLEKPSCGPHCSSLGRLYVEATPERVRLRLEASAVVATPIPLPGRAGQWLPSDVLLDGKPATALHRDGDGRLWLHLPAGGHQVVLEGPPAGGDAVQISFVQKPHAVQSALRGWTLEGVGEEGEIAETLQLSRASQGAAAAAGEGGGVQTLPAFVAVERTLRLGLKWEVETHVVRTTPAGAAIVVEVPLLPRESVVSEGTKVGKGKVQVNMGAADAETTWRSVLEPRSPIALEAAGAAWAEVWRLDLGPIWDAKITGIPPVHPGDAGGGRLVEWRPWPGERVNIEVTRPGGTGGRTLTIDGSTLELHPGARATEASLALRARSSRGGQHTLVLPEGAVLSALSLGGRAQPLRQEGRRVTFPLSPGAVDVSLAFRTPDGLGPFFRTPEVDLGAPSVNAELHLALPDDRWLLLCGGPRLGPAVLVWSVLVLVVVAGLLLGRARLTPLRAHHWILLGLGFAPMSVIPAVVVVGYLLALGWRRVHLREARPWVHNLAQLALVGWTLAVVGVLLGVVREGLLATPDMGVTGNGSYAALLRWTIDRAPGPLPQAWALSVPLTAFHVVMLAWALWLAASLIRWSKWAWACFTDGGPWRRSPKRAPPPAKEAEEEERDQGSK